MAPHEPVQNFGDRLFFVQPEAAGRYQIEQALKAKPTLLVGIDFLFWFCYGDGSTDKDRLQRFEKGLKLLESVECLLRLPGQQIDAYHLMLDVRGQIGVPGAWQQRDGACPLFDRLRLPTRVGQGDALQRVKLRVIGRVA